MPKLLAKAGVRQGLVLTDSKRLPYPKDARVPRGVGVIVRAYGPEAQKEWVAWRSFGRKCGHLVLVSRRDGRTDARKPRHAREPDLFTRSGFGAVTAAAHTRRAIFQAKRCGVKAVLVSPVFPTASHPGSKTLGPHRFARLIRGCGMEVFALGGLSKQTAAHIKGIPGLAGIAAIDGWV